MCGFVSPPFVLAHVSRVCYLKRLSVPTGQPVSIYLNCRSLPFLSHCRFLSYYAISCPLSTVPCLCRLLFRLVSVAVLLLIINFLLSTGRAPRCAAKESHHQQQQQSLCICLYDLYNLHICPSELVRSVCVNKNSIIIQKFVHSFSFLCCTFKLVSGICWGVFGRVGGLVTKQRFYTEFAYQQSVI